MPRFTIPLPPLRERGNLVERGVILGDGPTLTTRELSDLTSTPSSLPAAEELELAILEERAIRAVFEQSGGNQAETARLLGIGTDALRYRLRNHALR